MRHVSPHVRAPRWSYALGALTTLFLALGCAGSDTAEAPDDERDVSRDASGDPATDSPGSDGGAADEPDARAPVDAGREPGKSKDASAREDAQAAQERDASRPDDERPTDAAASDAAAGPQQPDSRDGGQDAAVGCGASANQTPRVLSLSGNLGTHDPVVIEADGQYHLFHTGRGIPTKTSADLRSWRAGPPVFASNPAWVSRQVAGATDLWAPDIAYFGGLYHLYYSASTFGSNRSCIGHATREQLTRGSWQDHGSVICSNAGGARDDWNAIDPHVVLDEDGTPWMSFGSFWSGIKMVKLDQEGRRADDQLIALAGRRNGGAIEAPTIVQRCGYYYLFVSFDRCCNGAESTYKVMVGRSRTVEGPYVDKAGVAMRDGGGTLLLESAGSWRGPGHNDVLLTPEGDYHIYHAYSARDGHPELRIAELAWDADGWPRTGGP